MHKYKLSLVYITVCILTITACKSHQADVQIQGHRGCRGLYPENTLPAFSEAVKLGVDVLELDVVVTKDSQIVV